MTTKREFERQRRQESVLMGLGFSAEESAQLRRISMTLNRWYELECGSDAGAIERDEKTNKPYWRSGNGQKWPTADRESGALKRLADIMSRHAPLSHYIQGDPRGAALYILRPDDVPSGADPGAYYDRGIAVY